MDAAHSWALELPPAPTAPTAATNVYGDVAGGPGILGVLAGLAEAAAMPPPDDDVAEVPVTSEAAAAEAPACGDAAAAAARARAKEMRRGWELRDAVAARSAADRIAEFIEKKTSAAASAPSEPTAPDAGFFAPDEAIEEEFAASFRWTPPPPQTSAMSPGRVA